ncbi:glycosyltransferase family 4 protein [Neobacillus kokaensis]|uniref:Glycosyl transferase family 1 domain-containing protein n=1 Tax=Neobacillus kokaensis TaxID=2759023 RepID=A0ABQ3MZI8_9BACI|nr:glycosyltransferase family 4 protein [Neobacillus kokaensis]GHH97719.1 hypothetical protein AM1BK_12620 [Neobacillus kokaensis]
MKDILIVAHFSQMPGEKGNGRFVYLAEMLENNGYKVEIVTTSFSHATKKHRKYNEEHLKQNKYKFTLLDEIGYCKNVSLRRLFSHYLFGRNLGVYLNERKKPDIIYCAVPSLDASYIAAKYAIRNKVKFVIDIQDIWPEAFNMVFNTPIISKIIFLPMNRKANFIYSAANHIVAVSETYVKRALDVNKKCKKGLSVFLGTELSNFDKFAEESKVVKPKNEIWIAYIGTLGHSYDLTSVIDAFSILRSKGYRNLKFIVMGDGPLKKDFQMYAMQKGIPCEFTGMLDYSKMVEILVKCDIAVNPITRGAAASIINKVSDYAAAGLAVINTQECQEYQNLIDKYYAGINCRNNNSKDLSEKIQFLYNEVEIRKEMGRNNRKLAEEKFDRHITYQRILDLISIDK